MCPSHRLPNLVAGEKCKQRWGVIVLPFLSFQCVDHSSIHFPTLCRFAVSTQWEQEVLEGRAPRDVHTYFCCCARRIGHMFALLSYPDGTPIVIAGPCWPFCFFVTCKWWFVEIA